MGEAVAGLAVRSPRRGGSRGRRLAARTVGGLGGGRAAGLGLGLLAGLALAACGQRAFSPASPAAASAAISGPCHRLVRCCQAINRDDPSAQKECEDYLGEKPPVCVGLFAEVRRRSEGVLPVGCR